MQKKLFSGLKTMWKVWEKSGDIENILLKMIDPALLKINTITIRTFKNGKSKRTNRVGEEMIAEDK